MGLTRTEQWTLLGLALIMAGGFGVQFYQSSRGEPVVWVESGPGWQGIRDDGSVSSGLHGDVPSNDLQIELPGWQATRAASAPGEPSAPANPTRIDVNLANTSELALLPGIGTVKATEIVEYREKSGLFESVDELVKVRGLGPKTVERLRPYVTVRQAKSGEPLSPGLAGNDTGRAIHSIGVSEVTRPKLDLNQATEEELQALPGVGPVIAGRIIQYRELRPIRSTSDLLEIPGIGPVKLEKIQAWLEQP